MPLTQADVDRLDAAIATSVLEVELDGERVRYRSVDELRAARAHTAQVVAAAAAQATAGTSRGSYHFSPILGRER